MTEKIESYSINNTYEMNCHKKLKRMYLTDEEETSNTEEEKILRIQTKRKIKNDTNYRKYIKEYKKRRRERSLRREFQKDPDYNPNESSSSDEEIKQAEPEPDQEPNQDQEPEPELNAIPDDDDPDDEDPDESDEESDDDSENESENPESDAENDSNGTESSENDEEYEGEEDSDDDGENPLRAIKRLIREQVYNPVSGLNYGNEIFEDILQENLDMRNQIKPIISRHLAKQAKIFRIDELENYGQQNSAENLGNMMTFPFIDTRTGENLNEEIFNRWSNKTDHFQQAIKGYSLYDEKDAARYWFGRGNNQQFIYKYIHLSVREQLVRPGFYLPQMLLIPTNMGINETQEYADQLVTIFHGRSNRIPVNRITNVTISLLAQIRYTHIKSFIKYVWMHGGLHREEDKTILLKVLGYPQPENMDDNPFMLPENFDWQNHVTQKLEQNDILF